LTKSREIVSQELRQTSVDLRSDKGVSSGSCEGLTRVRRRLAGFCCMTSAPAQLLPRFRLLLRSCPQQMLYSNCKLIPRLIMVFGRQRILHHCLTWGLLLLSVAVFNWGLQYKMSLYHSDTGSNPPAKFWTGRSDADGTSVEIAKQKKPPSGNVLLSALLCLLLFCRFAVQRLRPLAHLRPFAFAHSAQTIARYHALFLRPPPHQLKFA
jgi:hypothetical protein